MSRTRLLLDLQKIDLTRDAAVARLSRIAAALGANPAAAEALAAVKAAEEALAGAERELRQCSAERDTHLAHVRTEEEKLYSGRTQSTREVQNLQRETDALKRRLAGIDDRVLEAMLARDEAAAALARAKESLALAERSSQAAHAELLTEKSRLSVAVHRLQAQRTQLIASIHADDHALYTRLRTTKAGRPIAEVQEGSCGACGIELPVEEAHRATEGVSLVLCTGCGRILHG